MEILRLILGLLLCLSSTQGAMDWREYETLLDTNRVVNKLLCKQLMEDMEKCIDEALNKYVDEMFGGSEEELFPPVQGETKPHFYARKTCNQLTIQFECANLVEPCIGESAVLQVHDGYTKSMLKLVEKLNIPDFDSNKCPITKFHMEHNSGYFVAGSLCLVAVSAVLGLIC